MIDSKAYTQVYYIIQNMSEELKKKIPQELISIIEKNKDDEYKIETDNIDELDILEDTQKVLSVIYTDYIASEEERMVIKNKEKIISLKREEEKKKKYDIDIFEEKDDESNLEKNKKLEIAVIEKEKWYIRIIKRIKEILKKTGV